MSKVLVVDDSLSVRKVVGRALAGRRIDVVEAASGSVALELIERESPDLIVCDVIMPDRDGYEICAFVRGHPRLGGTPVLLMSGIVDDSVRERAVHVGADDILFKPFAAGDFVERLERLLSTSTPSAGRAMRVDLGGASPVVSARTNGAELGSILRQFTIMDGVQWAVLADREGLVLEATEGPIDVGVGGAFTACLTEASQGLGRELGRGAVSSMIVEFEKGTVVLWNVGAMALLAVGLDGSSALGKVRYYARKALAELAQAL